MPSRQSLMFRLHALVAGGLALSLLVVCLPAAASVPPYTLEERAAAIASPSLVYVEVRSTGFLRKKDTGEAMHLQAIIVTSRCSGIVVSPQGHVVSSTHCVQQAAESIHRSAAGQFAQQKVVEGQVAANQRESFVGQVLEGSEFAGDGPGSKPTRKVFGQLFRGQSGLTTEPAFQGEVLEALPIGDADVALLKMVQSGLPVVELAGQAVDTNAPLFLVAFNSESNSDAFTVRTKAIKITGRYGAQDPVVYQLDGDLGPASHGGMVIDSAGRVVSMINADMSSKDKLNRLITNQQHIVKLMTNANVPNSLSSTDSTYRTAINDYFGGRYSEAIKKFDHVLGVMPDHSLAASYRRQAADRLAIEGEPNASTLPTWLVALLIGLGIALVLCLGIIVWLVVRRRSVSAAAMYGPYAPVSGMPISGMPISAAPVSGVGQDIYGYHPGFPPEEGIAMAPPVQVEWTADDPSFTFPETTSQQQDGTRDGLDQNNPWAR